MISKYLIELIENNNRIIIPDLGAFMVQDTPTGKQISFNDFLKFNDGLLINQIIKTDKISKDEASSKVKSFISEVEKSFAKNEHYELKGIGALSKDSHGNIKFNKKAEGSVKKVEESKKEAEPKKPIVEKTEQKATVESKVSVGSKVEPKKEEVKPIINKQQKETVNSNANNNTKKSMPTQQKSRVSQKTNVTQESSNNTIINIIIVIMILGFFIWLAIHFDLMSKFNKEKKEIKATVEVVEPQIENLESEEEVVEDNKIDENIIAVEEPVVDETPAEQEVSVVDDNRTVFYLVAGSFKIKSNADGFNQKLINEGYENSQIIARNNGFSCVSFKSFYTWKEAVAEWRQMKVDHPEVWILKQ